MLRKRSRPVSCSKQGMMTDPSSLLSPRESTCRTSPSIFSSPRHFSGFSSTVVSDSEPAMSPTSILDGKPFLGIGCYPLSSDKGAGFRKPGVDSRHLWDNIDCRGVGLGIVDALSDKNDKKLRKPDRRMVLFGSQIKIKIPPLPTSAFSSAEPPGSPSDFGIKTNKFQSSLASSPSPSPCSVLETDGSAASGHELLNPTVVMDCLSPNEMELSEDYTCVISHGPNPRTTHIFNNYVLQNCRVGVCADKKQSGVLDDQGSSHSFVDFLSSCYACKKKLGPGKDVYMYRGDKAFCSLECRTQEMLFDDGV